MSYSYAYLDVLHLSGKEQTPQPLGRIHMALYNDITPNTVRNFATLCEGRVELPELPKVYVNPLTRKRVTHFSYKNTFFHRLIPGFMIQGGDFTEFNGTGGLSIYGSRFRDENFQVKFNKPFLVACANAGPNTNNSQFFITTAPTPHLNGKHVVFGEVFDRYSQSVVKKIETFGSQSGKTKGTVVVANCGLVDPIVSNRLLNHHRKHGLTDIDVISIYKDIQQKDKADAYEKVVDE